MVPLVLISVINVETAQQFWYSMDHRGSEGDANN